MTRKEKVAAIIFLILAVTYVAACIVCNQVYIKNVFDEIYYSEMHPFLFKYTLTDFENLRGFVAPGDTYYEDGGKWIVFSPRGEMRDKYYICLSSVQKQRDVTMSVAAVYETYTIEYYYYYDTEKKELIFAAVYIDENDDFMRIKKDNAEAFLEEMGLPEDYLETQSKVNLDDLLSHWFDMNNGLSRFSLDDLGDFTIEYAFYSSNGFGS